ncbi:glycosyltransferase [Brevibacterium sp. 5221]|uniref:Glycosyltransferase n=1 Tax=Brevibacterium rongguiense TaxID=2695267 RepID=A0A6N9H3D0_9MICO|nr:glycosyltransferase [Brevibacterium rongguiense]MYM18469.1 glycosyltransferase [Brevibacterium rongguiense]
MKTTRDTHLERQQPDFDAPDAAPTSGAARDPAARGDTSGPRWAGAPARRPGPAQDPAPGAPRTATTVDLVVPVFNEEAQLVASVDRLLAATAHSPHAVTIVIADNASTDDTPVLASHLATSRERVRWVRLGLKGRGRALKQVWSDSSADVVAYTDVDLATDVRLLDPMIAVLASGHSDVAIASRLRRDARVERGAKREIISRCYNRLLRGFLDVNYSDAQCGFKAMSRRAADAVLPHVEDTGWFFDTEVLTLAQWSGLRIHEFAADWTDDPDSSVDVVRTALDDLHGMWRMRRELRRNTVPLERIAALVGRPPAVPNTGTQLLHFVDVGILCTVVYSLGFLVLGHLMPLGAANLTALLGSAILNTALNRRYSFGAQNPRNTLGHHIKGLAVFALCWALTSAAIALTAGQPTIWVLVAVTGANVLATVVRFALQRLWVFADAVRPGRRRGSVLARVRAALADPSREAEAQVRARQAGASGADGRTATGPGAQDREA